MNKICVNPFNQNRPYSILLQSSYLKPRRLTRKISGIKVQWPDRPWNYAQKINTQLWLDFCIITLATKKHKSLILY
ncbi:hypothetical protein CRENPOLYSF2_90008 [Crenothrix polyspora]|uniref:Uncharacterized protein n=1 Tax=Crenothrix polyspora TaxID=360316 RepID=A0A1R4HIS9_9GAMM|nr:hypothetical protein CRENPOLYSF2_90008 [Crenothrix polyspora]